jgi:hypothetical protein
MDAMEGSAQWRASSGAYLLFPKMIWPDPDSENSEGFFVRPDIHIENARNLMVVFVGIHLCSINVLVPRNLSQKFNDDESPRFLSVSDDEGMSAAFRDAENVCPHDCQYFFDDDTVVDGGNVCGNPLLVMRLGLHLGCEKDH